MRQAGTLSNQADANRFADYLFAQGISVKVDPDGEAWAIWIREEEHVPRAVEELAQFVANPADGKYTASGSEAKARREKLARREEQARRNYVDMRRRWDGAPAGPIPLTIGLVAICVLIAILTNLGGGFGSRDDGPAMGLVDKLLLVPLQDRPSQIRVVGDDIGAQLRWDALNAVRAGEVWRLVTPILLHFSPWHLLFNMAMFYRLGGMIEGRRGSLRFAALVLISAVLSNFSQFYVPSLADPVAAYGPFGGMSGVVYALFGYVWMKSRYEPSAELYVHPNTVVLMLVWLVACGLGFLGPIANWAHGVGLTVGLAIGIAHYAWRQVLKRVRRKST
jgi:GlpG protein